MRAISLDIGTVRIGVALSCPRRRFASPLETVAAQPRNAALARIIALVEQHEVVDIVVGLPLELDGRPGRRARQTRAFTEALASRVHVPIHEWDERMSSRSAERALLEADVGRRERKDTIDRVAAAIFLQSWLDERGATPEPDSGVFR